MKGHSNFGVVFLLLVSVTMASQQTVHQAVPAIYILGDSTADVGTNTYIASTYVKADHSFHGIDFPGSVATGRFSNGFNSADFLSQLMGFRRSPRPYLALTDKESLRPTMHIVKGANFASAGSGILDITGVLMGNIINMTTQIKQFTSVVQDLEKLFGKETTQNKLSKSVVFISTGSNDIFSQFFANVTTDKQEFITSLIHTYENQLRTLYSDGARRFGIISVPPIGCCPSQRVYNTSTGGCLEDLNVYSRLFYVTVSAMLEKLSSELDEMKYSLGNTNRMVTDMMENPYPFGFQELQTACCGNGKYNGQSECSPSAKLCANRDKYLFWDWFHPTEATSKLAANALYNGPSKYVTPINFKQLAED